MCVRVLVCTCVSMRVHVCVSVCRCAGGAAGAAAPAQRAVPLASAAAQDPSPALVPALCQDIGGPPRQDCVPVGLCPVGLGTSTSWSRRCWIFLWVSRFQSPSHQEWLCRSTRGAPAALLSPRGGRRTECGAELSLRCWGGGGRGVPSPGTPQVQLWQVFMAFTVPPRASLGFVVWDTFLIKPGN